jgi:hypothetical protein
MEPGRARDVSVSVHPDRDAHAYCSAYADRAPILSISHADVSITVSPSEGSALGVADLAFARDLAEAANIYLAEMTRLYAEQDDQVA